MKDGKPPTRWRKWPKWMTCASVDLRIGGKGVSVLCTLEQQSGRRRRYKYRCLHPGLSGWRSGERRDPGESGVVRRVVTGRALPPWNSKPSASSSAATSRTGDCRWTASRGPGAVPGTASTGRRSRHASLVGGAGAGED